MGGNSSGMILSDEEAMKIKWSSLKIMSTSLIYFSMIDLISEMD